MWKKWVKHLKNSDVWAQNRTPPPQIFSVFDSFPDGFDLGNVWSWRQTTNHFTNRKTYPLNFEKPHPTFEVWILEEPHGFSIPRACSLFLLTLNRLRNTFLILLFCNSNFRFLKWAVFAGKTNINGAKESLGTRKPQFYDPWYRMFYSSKKKNKIPNTF